MKKLLILIAALLACAASAAPAAAQVVIQPDTLTPVAEPIPPEPLAPRAAFIRAMLVPGWGHFAQGETRRGAVYFTLQATSWAMLVKSMSRLGEARSVERRLTGLAVDSLEIAMAADTALARQLDNVQAYEQALLTYPGLGSARDLATSRQRHRQDWIVYTIVFTFASAIDAYVTAHLADFPVDVSAGRSSDNGVAIGVRVPAGRR